MSLEAVFVVDIGTEGIITLIWQTVHLRMDILLFWPNFIAQ
jgi:hypothetical protein